VTKFDPECSKFKIFPKREKTTENRDKYEKNISILMLYILLLDRKLAVFFRGIFWLNSFANEDYNKNFRKLNSLKIQQGSF